MFQCSFMKCWQAGLGGILFSVLSILSVTISFSVSMGTEAGVSGSNFQRLGTSSPQNSQTFFLLSATYTSLYALKK